MQEVVEAGSQGRAQTTMDRAHPPAAPQARQISWAVLPDGQPKGVGRPSQVAMHSSKVEKRLAFPPQPPQLVAVQEPLMNAYTRTTASHGPTSKGSAHAGAGVQPASLAAMELAASLPASGLPTAGVQLNFAAKGPAQTA